MAEGAAVSEVVAGELVEALFLRLLDVRVWALGGAPLAGAFLSGLSLVASVVPAPLVAYRFAALPLEPFTMFRACALGDAASALPAAVAGVAGGRAAVGATAAAAYAVDRSGGDVLPN